MKDAGKIPITTVLERLSKAVHYPLGMNHFAVLMHGWEKKHPDQAPPYHTLFQRKRLAGCTWLTRQEVADLGRYAGYNLLDD